MADINTIHRAIALTKELKDDFSDITGYIVEYEILTNWYAEKIIKGIYAAIQMAVFGDETAVQKLHKTIQVEFDRIAALKVFTIRKELADFNQQIVNFKNTNSTVQETYNQLNAIYTATEKRIKDNMTGTWKERVNETIDIIKSLGNLEFRLKAEKASLIK